MYTKDLLSKPSLWTCCVALSLWFVMDIGTTVYGMGENEFMSYLTNQVWVVGIFSRVAISAEVFYRLRKNSTDLTARWQWFNVIFFMLFGVLQCGVFVTFSVLIRLDSSLLDDILENQGRSLADIIGGNDVRHFLPIFMHLIVVFCLRAYMSTVLIRASPGRSGVELDKGKVALTLWMIPTIAGIVHSAVFDDSKLYKYGSVGIGTKCQLVFAATALVTVVFMIYVVVDKAVKRGTMSISAALVAMNAKIDAMEKDVEVVEKARKPDGLGNSRLLHR